MTKLANRIFKRVLPELYKGMKRKDVEAIIFHCVVCTAPIDLKRSIRRSSTCSPDCLKFLRNWRKQELNTRECDRCMKPSTPEERQEFRHFRQVRHLLPEYSQPSMGRPRKNADGVRNTSQKTD